MAPDVNPGGLRALGLWQTDVTHVPEFGRLSYVHVSMDTFSGACWASAHCGECALHGKVHFLQAWAALGVPSAVKTDNGSAYTSQSFAQLLSTWGVCHILGIPRSSTGQAIVERMHSTLKSLLQKQKEGMLGATPHDRLHKAVFTRNHLTLPAS